MAISTREKLIASSIFLLLFALVAFGQVKRWPQSYGDSAFFGEMIDNICAEGKPMTHINASAVVAWKALYSPPEVGCGMAMGHLPSINEFDLHVYSIVYLLAPFSYVIPTAVLLPSLMVLAFVGLLFFVYLYARNRQVAIPWVLLFCLLVSLHPAWKISVFGQSYVDRLFLPLGWLLLWALTAATPRLHWIFLAGAACTALNDRTGIMCAFIMLGYLVLYPQALKGQRLKVALMAGCFGAISYYLFKYHITSYAVGFLPPLRHLFDFTDTQQHQLVLLAAVNIPLLLLALWDWRTLLIVGALMFPNIFGNVGGAEKTGWGTHYHSYYFPVLVWAALRGYQKLNDWRQSGGDRGRWRTVAVAAAALALVGYGLTIHPDKVQVRFERAEIANNPWSRAAAQSWAHLQPVALRPVNHFEDVARYIPPGAAVSMCEWGMPTLYPGRDIYLLPTGVDHVDYLIMGIKRQEGGRYIYNDISPYTDPVSREKLNECYFRRLADNGFDLDHPKVFGNSIAVVEKRKSAPPPAN